jgi:hypothetical protein
MTAGERMAYGAMRPLTAGERSLLSAGLAEALDAAGARPVIIARPSALARLAGLWRGGAPIMVLGRRIFWPDAYVDTSKASGRAMSILQHELQHVLEFAAGELSVWRYVASPRNWTYAYRLTDGSRWADFGAEQRAQLAQDYWLAERGLLSGASPLAVYRALIPWAGADGALDPKGLRE